VRALPVEAFVPEPWERKRGFSWTVEIFKMAEPKLLSAQYQLILTARR
jgi:hypothetical protein